MDEYRGTYRDVTVLEPCSDSIPGSFSSRWERSESGPRPQPQTVAMHPDRCPKSTLTPKIGPERACGAPGMGPTAPGIVHFSPPETPPGLRNIFFLRVRVCTCVRERPRCDTSP